MLALLLYCLSSEDELPILLEKPLKNELLPETPLEDGEFWKEYWKQKQPEEQRQIDVLDQLIMEGALTGDPEPVQNTPQKGTLMFSGKCRQPECVPRNVTFIWQTGSYGGGISLQIELEGPPAWLGVGVSSDGNMVGGGRYFGRLWRKYIPSPAVVAVWEAGLPRPLRYSLRECPSATALSMGSALPLHSRRSTLIALPHALLPNATSHTLRALDVCLLLRPHPATRPAEGYSETDAKLATEGYLVNVYQDGFPYVPYGGAVAARTDEKTMLQLVLPYTHDCREGRLAVCIDGPTHFILAHGEGDTWRRHPTHGMFAVRH